MANITDNARTAQLGKERVFIYITHSRSGVKLFGSRELSAIGVNKRLVRSDDPAAQPVRQMIDHLIGLSRRAGMGGRGGSLPTADGMKPFVAEAARLAGVKEAEFLPRTPCYSARILVTL